MTSGTLIYIIKGAHILLAKKKSGEGAGFWTGLGGTIDFGETAKISAIKIAQQVSGLTPTLVEPLGEILYHDKLAGNWKVSVFRTEEFNGEAVPATDFELQWWPIDQLRADMMPPGDDEWMPLVLENKKFLAELWFNGKGKVEKRDVQKVS